jgi:hypothetical protein
MIPSERESREIEWLSTGSPNPTVRYRGVLLHSPIDPIPEAEKIVAPLVSSRISFCLIFGLGLGYHVATLRRKLPQAEILVYEPHEEIHQAALKVGFEGWPRDPQIRVFRQMEELEDFLIEHCIYCASKPFPTFWVYPPYRSLAIEEIARLDSSIHLLQIRQATNLRTQKEKKNLWLQNILANWPRLISAPNVCQLKGIFPDLPCIIVGAGPSLDQNGPLLQGLQGKSILFSSGSALGWLKERGIQPNFAAIFEGEDVSSQLRAHKSNDAEWLGLSSSTHPHHFMAVMGKHFVFHTEPWVAEVLAQEPFIPHGGNISSAAFTMAVVMGCNPIVLVGQDLSYRSSELHASGIQSEDDEKVRQFRRYALPGQKGSVWGHSAMVSYLSWFEESARYLAKARPDLLLINATAEGARIRGFEEMPLGEVEKFLEPLRVDIPSILEGRLGSPDVDWRAVRKRLEEIYLRISRTERLAPDFLNHPAGHLYQWLMQGELTMAEEGEARLHPKMVGQALKVVQILMEKTEEREERPQKIYRTFSRGGGSDLP